MFTTKLSSDDPYLALLGLPHDRKWYRFAARSGIGLPWIVGRSWPRKLDWSGVGTPVDSEGDGCVALLAVPGEPRYVQLWVQHIGDPREDIYLEARWYPEEGRNRVALHGLECNPSDALISSVARARDWFAPARQTDATG